MEFFIGLTDYKNVKISINFVSVKKYNRKFQKNFVGRQNCRINGSIFNMYRTIWFK